MKLPFINNKKGFTIIETLVAIAIIMSAIAGPLTIAQRGLNAAVIARDQFIAQYLAQDAIEQFYYFRDLNIKNGQSWLASVPTAHSGCTTSYCRIDSYSNTFEAMPSSQSQIQLQSLLYKTPTGFFTHQTSGNTQTQFRRYVRLRNISANEIALTATVFWQNGRVTNQVEVVKNVYNQ